MFVSETPKQKQMNADDDKNLECECDANSLAVAYLDDSGVVIPPEAEASVLMHVELSMDEDCAGGVKSLELIRNETDDWYTSAVSATAFLRHEVEQWSHAQVTTTATPLKSVAASAQSSSPAEAEESYDDMMLGVGDASYSREFTDEEEWVLETILARRRQKVPGEESANAPRRHDEYLCKWKWYTQTTWEPREVLEEMGYVSVIDEFHAKKMMRTASPTEEDASYRRFVSGTLHRMVHDWVFRSIHQAVGPANISILRYAPVLNSQLEHRFLRRWAEDLRSVPCLLFHGTRSVNVDSIARRGFVVPGQAGVKIANGSAYGVGIYATTSPGYAVNYSDNDCMFVCLGLVGPQYFTVGGLQTKAYGAIHVFHDNAVIIPLLLVQYRRPNQRRPLTDEEERLSRSPQEVPLAALAAGAYGTLWRQHAAETRRNRSNESANTAPVAPRDAMVSDDRPPLQQFSKRLLKQMPRSIKDAYAAGRLRAK